MFMLRKEWHSRGNEWRFLRLCDKLLSFWQRLRSFTVLLPALLSTSIPENQYRQVSELRFCVIVLWKCEKDSEICMYFQYGIVVGQLTYTRNLVLLWTYPVTVFIERFRAAVGVFIGHCCLALLELYLRKCAYCSIIEQIKWWWWWWWWSRYSYSVCLYDSERWNLPL